MATRGVDLNEPPEPGPLLVSRQMMESEMKLITAMAAIVTSAMLTVPTLTDVGGNRPAAVIAQVSGDSANA